jgi:hypothetical protein
MRNEGTEQILETTKVYYRNQLNGMKTSEMDFGEAKMKMASFIKAQEPLDGLVSGDGLAWTDMVSVYTAPVSKYTNESSPRVESASRCCVAS